MESFMRHLLSRRMHSFICMLPQQTKELSCFLLVRFRFHLLQQFFGNLTRTRKIFDVFTPSPSSLIRLLQEVYYRSVRKFGLSQIHRLPSYVLFSGFLTKLYSCLNPLLYLLEAQYSCMKSKVQIHSPPFKANPWYLMLHSTRVDPSRVMMDLGLI